MSRFQIHLSVWTFLCVILCSVHGADQSAARNPAYLSYIERWKATALDQQAQYGIPASITLAQGLLESGAGQSDLAMLANNHFGIKCHSDWQGKTFRKDDDSRDECFRSYRKAEDSFRDHSLFLKRKRYEVLFTYKVTDYKAWANGLKTCGYATDPKYPQKLIQIIETYDLDKLGKSVKPGKHDKPVPADPGVQVAQTALTDKPAKADKPGRRDKRDKQSKQNKQSKQDKQNKQNRQNKDSNNNKQAQQERQEQQKRKERQEQQTQQAQQKQQSQPQTAYVQSEQSDTVEWTPSQLRTNTPYPEHAYGKINGRRFIVAQDGDTWGGIAYTAGMEEKTLRRINEATEGQALHGGDKVYFLPKRNRADVRHTQHTVMEGETVWFIAQYYGIRMKTLYRLNGLEEGAQLTVGQVLRMR